MHEMPARHHADSSIEGDLVAQWDVAAWLISSQQEAFKSR